MIILSCKVPYIPIIPTQMTITIKNSYKVPVKIRYGMSTILDGYICDYPLMEGGEKLCQ
jgi:hypothetical protein